MSSVASAGTRRPFPGFLQGLLLVLLLLLLQVACAIAGIVVLVIVNRALGRSATASVQHPALLAAVNAMAFSAVIALGAWVSRAPLRDVLPVGRLAWRAFPTLLLVLFGYSIVFSELDNLLRMVMAPPRWLNAILMDLATGSRSPWGTILATVVVAPIVEEALFRGVILRGFLLRYSATRAVLLSALLFAIVHANPWQFAGPLALGLVLGWLFCRTRSLATVMLAHATVNCIPLVVPAIGFAIPGYSEGLGAPPVLQPLWFDLVGLGLTATGLAGLALSLPRAAASD